MKLEPREMIVVFYTVDHEVRAVQIDPTSLIESANRDFYPDKPELSRTEIKRLIGQGAARISFTIPPKTGEKDETNKTTQ